MVDSGLAFNVGRNPTFADGLLAIVSDRAAMTFSYSSALRSVVDALEKGAAGVEMGVSGLPGVPGSTGAAVPGGRALWILNLRPEREQEASWKFIKWLMEPEQQAEWFAGSGYLPVSHAAVDLPAAKDVIAKYPQFQVPLDLYLKAPATPAGLGALLGPFRQVRESHQPGGGGDALRRQGSRPGPRGRRNEGRPDHQRLQREGEGLGPLLRIRIWPWLLADAIEAAQHAVHPKYPNTSSTGGRRRGRQRPRRDYGQRVDPVLGSGLAPAAAPTRYAL